MQATQQQQDIIKHVNQGSDLVAKARAGTGKTSCVEMVARSRMDRNILLLCFNKDVRVAADARMPANVTAKTFHQLGWHSHGKYFQNRTPQRVRFVPKIIARRLGCEDRVANIARETVRRFTASADSVVSHWHVPRESYQALPENQRNNFKEEVVTAARRLWNMKCSYKERDIPVEFDDWLKMYQMDRQRPKGQFDLVITDEAQDITPRDLAIVQNMRAQQLAVGDDFQQLYGWRGSIKDFKDFDIDEVKYLTESHRFGPEIAERANDVLSLLQHDAPPLIGSPHKASKVLWDKRPTTPYTVLCRTNAGLLTETLNAVRDGHSIHVVGDLMRSIGLLESAWYLSIGQLEKVTHPQMTLIGDWNAVQELAEFDTDLKVLVKQVETHSSMIPNLCEELRCAGEAPAHRADVIISTVHRSKGLQWKTVQMSDDFPDSLIYFSKKERKYQIKKAEVYCLYVALTRAEDTLYVNSTLSQIRSWRELLD